MARGFVTLTTDFGLADGYPGVMKGVILGIAPDVTIVDLSHEIHAQNIRQAAFALKIACPYFPPGTIHVAVVDPGVGTERAVLVVRTSRATFVGPDNGVLTWALDDQQIEVAVAATEARYWLPNVSRTFHGRDVFAPLAAHLAQGTPAEALGPRASGWVTLPFPRPKLTPDARRLSAEVIYVDHFGNLITNIQIEPQTGRVMNVQGGELTIRPAARIQIGQGRSLGLRRSYAEADPGDLLAVAGSSGYLELAIREGSAAALIGAAVGDDVQIEFVPTG